MSIELTMWRHSDETRKVIETIKKEIQNKEKEILEDWLDKSVSLDRAYGKALGVLEGLKYCLKQIEGEDYDG